MNVFMILFFGFDIFKFFKLFDIGFFIFCVKLEIKYGFWN